MGIFSWLFRKKQKKIKIGLALGSGGAKGYAEIGALKAFEENNITFDYIGGTSIGSIIGATYANGYSSTDILEMLKRVNFGDMKSIFMINIDTSNLKQIIDNSLGAINIEELKKPFVTVATNFETNEELDIYSGSVSTALCASSAYPPVFRPVEIDGKKYIDGAFTNSIPADLVRKMGADFVIGIDLKDHQSQPSIITKIFPTYHSNVEIPWQKGYENADIIIHPNLTGYNSFSFSDGNIFYDIGYDSAMAVMPKIKQMIKDFSHKKKKQR